MFLHDRAHHFADCGEPGIVYLYSVRLFRKTVKLPVLLTGGEVARPPAVITQSIMCGISAVFLGVCVASFVRARLNRKETAGPG